MMKIRIGMPLGAALALAAAGCAEAPAGPPGAERSELPGEPVALVRVGEAPRSWSGIDRRERLVVESREEWEQVWARLHGRSAPVPGVPQVDFGAEVVVVAAMGQRPTGGYAVEVTGAARQGGATTLRVVETSPGHACVVTLALTAPVDVVRVPRAARPLRFSEAQAVRDC